jgi:hypothetical protein
MKGRSLTIDEVRERTVNNSLVVAGVIIVALNRSRLSGSFKPIPS